MPYATELEWLVTHREENETQYDYFATEEKTTDFLRSLVGKAQYALLYQRIDFTVKLDVTVKSPRRRRKKEAKEGAASPQAAESGGRAGAPHPESQQAAGTNPASPVFPWTCEARFDDGPECPGRAEFDPATRGRFCSLHLTEIGLSGRMELHRRNHARNRPVRLPRGATEISPSLSRSPLLRPERRGSGER